MLLVCLQNDKIEDLESHNQIMKFTDRQRQSARFLRDEKMSNAFLRFINSPKRPIIFYREKSVTGKEMRLVLSKWREVEGFEKNEKEFELREEGLWPLGVFRPS